MSLLDLHHDDLPALSTRPLSDPEEGTWLVPNQPFFTSCRCKSCVCSAENWTTYIRIVSRTDGTRGTQQTRERALALALRIMGEEDEYAGDRTHYAYESTSDCSQLHILTTKGVWPIRQAAQGWSKRGGATEILTASPYFNEMPSDEHPSFRLWLPLRPTTRTKIHLQPTKVHPSPVATGRRVRRAG